MSEQITSICAATYVLHGLSMVNQRKATVTELHINSAVNSHADDMQLYAAVSCDEMRLVAPHVRQTFMDL